MKRLALAGSFLALSASAAMAQSIPFPKAELKSNQLALEGDGFFGWFGDDSGLGAALGGQFAFTDQLGFAGEFWYFSGDESLYSFSGNFLIEAVGGDKGGISVLTGFGLGVLTVEIQLPGGNTDTESAAFVSSQVQLRMSPIKRIYVEPFLGAQHAFGDVDSTITSFGTKVIYHMTRTWYVQGTFAFSDPAIYFFMVGVSKDL